jgi:L,D-transpeptidase YcbB
MHFQIRIFKHCFVSPMNYKLLRDSILLIVVTTAFVSCHRKKTLPQDKIVVSNVQELSKVIPESINQRLSALTDNGGVMDDSVAVFRLSALKSFYEQTGNAPGWSTAGTLNGSADSMFYAIEHADEVGLPSNDYHAAALGAALHQLRTSDESAHDANLWAKVDVMMTDAFMRMATHLHFGIAPRDSITLRKDTVFTDSLLVAALRASLQGNQIAATLRAFEPQHAGYQSLKAALVSFKGKYGKLHWDTLPTVYTDTPAFKQRVINRLVQTGHMDTTGGHGADTALLRTAIRAYQREFNMYEDGVAGKHTVQVMNRNFHDWMVQAAVNMDRWRKWPDTIPSRYIFVNVPGFHMEVMDSGQVAVESRVIVGAPRTRTPLLTSRMTNFVLYPYWRVPFSITIKEMLPAIKKDVHYLAKKNMEVIDKDGNTVDPETIEWSKMSKNYFPYVLRQTDGMENSLGIMKFNFANKFSVYLHDTNNRGLFKNTFRALSHGCVRVQQWDSLAMYLIRGDTRNNRDSVRAWLARGDKKQIDIQHSIPVYLRYFTAEGGKDGQMMFYDDIYGEDKVLKKQMKL